MTLRSCGWIVAGLAMGLLLVIGQRAFAAPVDCDKPVAPCNVCHSPVSALPYASCISKPWVAPSSAKAVKNPLSDSAAAAKVGQGYYGLNCEGCHGEKGNGAGPIAVKYSIPVADLTSAAVQKQTDGELFWKISHGYGAMPAWGALLTEELRWQLVAFVRTFKKPE
jgi:mono/diheme cytochrome c family protein